MTGDIEDLEFGGKMTERGPRPVRQLEQQNPGNKISRRRFLLGMGMIVGGTSLFSASTIEVLRSFFQLLQEDRVSTDELLPASGPGDNDLEASRDRIRSYLSERLSKGPAEETQIDLSAEELSRAREILSEYHWNREVRDQLRVLVSDPPNSWVGLAYVGSPIIVILGILVAFAEKKIPSSDSE